MKKLKTKLTETRACPFYEDVVGTICFALICGALGWVAVKYRNCKELLDAVKANYEYSKISNQHLRNANNKWVKAYRQFEDSIKNGLVHADGEWYRTEKIDIFIRTL